MKKYLVICYAPWEAIEKLATMTEGQRQKGMKPWMDWMEKYKDNLIDGGSVLKPALSIDADDKWGQSNKQVTGYSVVTVKDDVALKQMFNAHPHLAWHDGCTVEVSEFAKM